MWPVTLVCLPRLSQIRVGTEGMTVGIDINEGMLNIAREEAPDFSLIFSTLGIEHEQQQKY